MLADRVEARLQQVDVVHARNLHRVLEGEEDAFACAILGCHREQVVTTVRDRALRDLVAFAAREHLHERALARAVRAHDGVHFAGRNLQAQAVEDLALAGAHMEIVDLQHLVTL